MSSNHLSDLKDIIDDLDTMGRLVRITSEVDPHLDLAGIAAQFEGGPRAVLFEHIKGHKVPVLTGLYWSRELLGALMRRSPNELPQYVSSCIQSWQHKPINPVVVPNGPILEGSYACIEQEDVDLHALPIPVHAQKDGGAYLDAG